MKVYSRGPSSGAICNEAFPDGVGVSVRPGSVTEKFLRYLGRLGATQEDDERTPETVASPSSYLLNTSVQICAQARPAPATLEDAPGDEKRIRPKSHPGALQNVAQIRSSGQIRGQKRTEQTEIQSGKPDQVSPGLATGDGFQSGVWNRPIPRHGTIAGAPGPTGWDEHAPAS
ncbi:hypothetical protein ACLKA6_016907 [Drosophila palustris]